MKNKPNCYECKHCRDIPGNAHKKCVHPNLPTPEKSPFIELVSIMGGGLFMNNNSIGVTGERHGIKMGWFNFPLNFDPCWLLTCDGFDQKG